MKEARFWMAAAALNGAAAVAAGAFGAHALQGSVPEAQMHAFETGARLHLSHALVLFAVAWTRTRVAGPLPLIAGAFLLMGILFFSGSLYLYAVSGGVDFAFVTPVGGVLLIVGWIVLAAAAIVARPK